MKRLIRQTVFLSASHFAVRTIGLILRIWLSRELGAQAMGLVELAQSAQMLLITPVVSGLPASVSRMCAKADPGHQQRIARCGMLLSLIVSLPVCVLGYALREPLAFWLGDIRTLPSILVYLPCIPILGVSCALNGYYYGTDRPVPPALSELLEQIIRFLLCMRLCAAMRTWPVMLRAAAPALAALIGETAGLLLMLLCAAQWILGKKAGSAIPHMSVMREMLSLAVPLTGMKLVSSLMRTVNSALTPARLQLAGLSAQEALSRFGMMQGMMMPILMIPSFITCSLSMVSAPEVTRRQASGKPMRHLILRVLSLTLAIGLAFMLVVFLAAPLAASRLYRQAELLPLLRRSCLLVPVFSLNHVLGGLANGLGLQRYSLRISLYCGLLSVLTTYFLCANPAFGLWGAVIALAAGQVLSLVLNLFVVCRAAAEVTPPEYTA